MSLTFLSRTMDPADLLQLERELRYVDHQARPLPAERRWAYALALHAVRRWTAASGQPLTETLYDVGGAGSPFPAMLDDWTERDTVVIDPLAPHGETLSAFCVERDSPHLASVVTAHAMIEHVDDPEQFLYHCSCLLAPGGLLVLTTAYWNHCGPDQAHGHETRQRIYCPKRLSELRVQVRDFHLTPFGGIDPAWHGPQIDDYTLASLVLSKRR